MVSICSDLSMKELDDLVQMASDINRQLSTRVCSTLIHSIYLRNQNLDLININTLMNRNNTNIYRCSYIKVIERRHSIEEYEEEVQGIEETVE